LLLDGGGLAVGHAGGEDRSEIFIFFVAAGPSQYRPEVGLVHILGCAASAPVERSQLGLRGKAAMIRCAMEPAEGFFLVARESIFFIPLKIAEAHRILGRGIAFLRHLAKFPGGCGFDCVERTRCSAFRRRRP